MKLAEEVGFEPTDGRPSPVFKTGALNRSATLPLVPALPGAESSSRSRALRPDVGRHAPGAWRLGENCPYRPRRDGAILTPFVLLFPASPMTSFVDAIGLVAAALTTFAFLPQVIQTWRSRSTAGLNLSMLLVLTTGIALWLVYGLGIGQLPVILANGVTLVLVAVLLVLKLRDVIAGRGVMPGE